MPKPPSNRWDKRQWLDAMPYRLGTYVQTSETATVEVLAHAGFDYVIIDGEHSPLSLETIKHLIVACSGAGIVPFVRVRENNGPIVMAPLDIGAYGVQIPQIEMPMRPRKQSGMRRIIHWANGAPIPMFAPPGIPLRNLRTTFRRPTPTR